MAKKKKGMAKKKKGKPLIHKMNSQQFQHLIGGYLLGQIAVGLGVFKDKDFKIVRGRELKDGSYSMTVDVSYK